MTFKRRLLLSATAFIAASVASSAATAQSTSFPLTLANCGIDVTFEEASQRVVTVGQAATEILYELGLSERILGTSVWFDPVLEEFEEINAGIPRLADNDPSYESVLALRPDLVAIQFLWHVGPEGLVATRDMFHDVGIQTYVLQTDCLDKDDTVGSGGTRLAPYSIDSLYQSIEELAAIHDVNEAGEALIAELREREEAAIARAEALELDDVSAVFWISSAEMDVDPWVAGEMGVPGWMMSTLGIDNIVQSNEEWPNVGWEAIARANPDFIVVAQMDRRRFEADVVENKIEFLRTDPVTKHMEAVREDRIIVMDYLAMDPSIRNIAALEALADALETLGQPK